jgi:hypothetical protein
MFSETWDRTPYAMEAKILRPLLWVARPPRSDETFDRDQRRTNRA